MASECARAPGWTCQTAPESSLQRTSRTPWWSSTLVRRIVAALRPATRRGARGSCCHSPLRLPVRVFDERTTHPRHAATRRQIPCAMAVANTSPARSPRHDRALIAATNAFEVCSGFQSGREARIDRIRKPDVRDVSGMLVERVFLVSGVVKTVFSPNKKNKRSFFFFLVREKRGRTQL